MMWRAQFAYDRGLRGNVYHFETQAEALEFVLDRRYGPHARIWKEVPRG